MAQTKPLRIGVLGAANIARQFISAVAPSQLVTVSAIASRDRGKAEKFAHETGVGRSHGSYEELLADPAIDAIYNPLPNTLHTEWSIRATEAGKHVLCEKPLTTTAADARAMFAAAKRNNVHLVEAYPYMAQPLTGKLRQLLAAKAIGKPQIVRSSFGVSFSDRSDIRLKPDVGGGALLDAGSYALSLIRLVSGEAPQRVTATAHWADTGVDNTMLATLEFSSGLLAQMSCSLNTCFHRHALISGDAGTIETLYLNHPPVGGPPEMTVKRGTKVDAAVEIVEAEGGNGFFYEAESFARLVASGPAQWTGATPVESIDIAAMLEAISASAKSGKPVTLSA
jgi:D-xylose 1-dehydrogenase (NADP+, D-xylono-1,5-lactone-forming)